MGHFRGRLPVLAILATLFVLATAPPAVGTHSDPAIITALDEDGRYLDQSGSGLDAPIAQANANGIAFAWLDQGGDSEVAVSLADAYVEDLDQIGSRYQTVVVLTAEGFAASSTVYSQDELDRALDASFDYFRTGAAGPGLEAFGQALTGVAVGTTPSTTTQPDGSTASGSGGGIGLGTIIVGIAAMGGGFLLVRSLGRRRKEKRQASIDMEEDRAEIREQLKNNADRVITLGDRVIAKNDAALINRYEEASTIYQEVSLAVDGASTPAEVDELDDRIDHAEWQFEVIEAELDGLPVPPSPEQRAAEEAARSVQGPQSMPPPPTGPSDGGPMVTSPTTGRQYPRPESRRTSPAGTRYPEPAEPSGRRGGGGMGGLGGTLGSILGSVILGGLGGGNRSRRSQRRGGGLGDVFGGLGSSIGSSAGRGLGGGVLRRGGGSSSGRTGSTKRRSSSGRNRTRSSRSRGGRSF